MGYVISSESKPDLTLAENDDIRSVIQNVWIIMTTRKNTVPMYRDFGVEMNYLSRPSGVAENILAAELAGAIAEYEPRAKLLNVICAPGEVPGDMTVKVEVEINEQS